MACAAAATAAATSTDTTLRANLHRLTEKRAVARPTASPCPQIRPTGGQRCDRGEAFTNSQQGACKPSAAIGSQGLEAADDPSGHGTPPSPFTPHPDQLADLRTASETMAAVLFICALGQPLLLAHLNGFTAIGVHASQRLHRHRPAYLRLRLVCHAGMQPASHPDQLASSARFALLGWYDSKRI